MFVYGQTGAGKTFTMEGVSGDDELKGITPRAVDYIFDRINSTSEAYEYTVGCSFVAGPHPPVHFQLYVTLSLKPFELCLHDASRMLKLS